MEIMIIAPYQKKFFNTEELYYFKSNHGSEANKNIFSSASR